MKRVILPLILVIVIAGLLVAIGLLLQGKFPKLAELPQVTEQSDVSAHTVVTEVLPIGEYASLAYHYTSVVKDINALDIKGWTIPFTTRKYLFTFDGKVKLGVDGSKIRVDVPPKADSAEAPSAQTEAPVPSGFPVITISLPPIKILSHEIVDDSIEIFEQSQSIFNEIKIADTFKVTAAKKREMEEKIMAGDAVEDARASLEQQLGALITSLPGIKGEYELIFVWTQAGSPAPQ